MRPALASFLLEAHLLLRDASRDRGYPPGSALEQDLEAIAATRSLHAERRVRHGAHGGVYYSGLTPETDLFVYDGPEFLHIEAKDISNPPGRAIPTEFWARALDLHLGRSRECLPECRTAHFPVLVVSNQATDKLRAACVRWGICLLEPNRVPFPVLHSLTHNVDVLRDAGCSPQDLQWAALPFNDRFPRGREGILFPFASLRSARTVAALLRFQHLATRTSIPNIAARMAA